MHAEQEPRALLNRHPGRGAREESPDGHPLRAGAEDGATEEGPEGPDHLRHARHREVQEVLRELPGVPHPRAVLPRRGRVCGEDETGVHESGGGEGEGDPHERAPRTHPRLPHRPGRDRDGLRAAGPEARQRVRGRHRHARRRYPADVRRAALRAAAEDLPRGARGRAEDRDLDQHLRNLPHGRRRGLRGGPRVREAEEPRPDDGDRQPHGRPDLEGGRGAEEGPRRPHARGEVLPPVHGQGVREGTGRRDPA
mmetsp:Transcript_3111/g.7260  ORF Transcript_3111/g.7260 Transcript_3111/m.7260 type:complete len:253 (+) Transcript_3111:102-860(+)